MCLTTERCVLWADESHHAMYCVWLKRDVCCEQKSPIMLCNVFDCREMCSVSRWVPSCYVMCWLCREMCGVSRWVPSCYVIFFQSDVYYEQITAIMLCNVFDCREMCSVSRSVPSCYVMCLTVQRDVCCEQISPFMLCNVFVQRDVCCE